MISRHWTRKRLPLMRLDIRLEFDPSRRFDSRFDSNGNFRFAGPYSLYIFQSIAFEPMQGPTACYFLVDLGQRISCTTENDRETALLFQWISVLFPLSVQFSSAVWSFPPRRQPRVVGGLSCFSLSYLIFSFSPSFELSSFWVILRKINQTNKMET